MKVLIKTISVQAKDSIRTKPTIELRAENDAEQSHIYNLAATGGTFNVELGFEEFTDDDGNERGCDFLKLSRTNILVVKEDEN